MLKWPVFTYIGPSFVSNSHWLQRKLRPYARYCIVQICVIQFLVFITFRVFVIGNAGATQNVALCPTMSGKPKRRTTILRPKKMQKSGQLQIVQTKRSNVKKTMPILELFTMHTSVGRNLNMMCRNILRGSGGENRYESRFYGVCYLHDSPLCKPVEPVSGQGL